MNFIIFFLANSAKLIFTFKASYMVTARIFFNVTMALRAFLNTSFLYILNKVLKFKKDSIKKVLKDTNMSLDLNLAGLFILSI